MEKQIVAFLGLGSNLGDKKQNLLDAIELLNAHPKNSVEVISTFIESVPWGFESEHTFVNCCLKMVTSLTALELLAFSKEIECDLGRKEKSNKEHYSDRLIDIDILFYSNEIINSSDLIIPHPHLSSRDFVLKPLSEITPNLVHPVSKMTLSQLLQNVR